MNRHQRRTAAKSAKITPGPRATTPAALCELGFKLLQAGRVAEAEGCSRQALTQQPDHADALHLMGIVAFHKQQYDHAVDWIAGALRQVPKPEYLLSLGNALQQLGRLDEALKAYDRGVMFRPEDAELWKSMGNVLIKLGRLDEAVLSFQHALKFNPRHLEAASTCAQLLFDLKRYDEALAYFNQSDAIKPNRAAFYQMRGLCHARAMRFDEAMVDYGRPLPAWSTASSRSPSGSVMRPLRARPSCCTPTKGLAMRSSSSAMHRWWLRSARVSFSMFPVRSNPCCRGCPGCRRTCGAIAPRCRRSTSIARCPACRWRSARGWRRFRRRCPICRPFRRRAARNGKAGSDRTIVSASASCGPATGITRTITTGRWRYRRCRRSWISTPPSSACRRSRATRTWS